MLTLIEKFEQRKLAKRGAELYTITYSITSPHGKEISAETEVYASSQEHADELAFRIKSRKQEEINEGESIYARLGLDAREILNHKLGLFLPWKDPVYKRSIVRGIRLPALQLRSLMLTLKDSATRTNNSITKEQLTDDEMKSLLAKSLLGYFSSLVIILVGLMCLWNAIQVGLNKHALLFGVSALFCFVTGGLQALKVRYNRRKLINWRGKDV